VFFRPEIALVFLPCSHWQSLAALGNKRRIQLAKQPSTGIRAHWRLCGFSLIVFTFFCL